MKFISIIIISTSLFFITSSQEKSIEIEYEKENIKNIIPKENEDFNIVNTSYIHLKKSNEYLKLITLHDIHYQPLRYFREISLFIDKLEKNDIISNYNFGIVDNKVYYGYKESNLKKKYKEKMILDLKQDVNTLEYYFEISNIFLYNPLSEKRKLLKNHTDDYYGNLVLNSDKHTIIGSSIIDFKYILDLKYFKQCDFINPFNKTKSPTHIECSKNTIEEIKDDIPNITFEFGNYKFFAKRNNLFNNNRFYIHKGEDLDKWNFYGGLCKHFAMILDTQYKKLIIYFNIDEVKQFDVVKNKVYNFSLSYFSFYLFIVFSIFYLLKKFYFGKINKSKKSNLVNENEEELITL
jgi:hypothetical protein